MKMKGLINCFILAALLSVAGEGFVMGQESGTVPPGIHYQAVARDESGEIRNEPVDVKFAILAGAAVVYEELHHTATSQYGVFSLIIGDGEAINGTFSGIDWSTGNHSLQVDIDLGNGWKRMGTISFMSVPYALYAGKTLLQELTLDGNRLSISGVNKSVTVDADPENEIQDLQYNSSTRALSITGGQGVVLEPMAAFRASLGQGATVTLPARGEAKVIFADATTGPNYNVGGTYNTVTGEFKPPFEGIYTFNVSMNLPGGLRVILKIVDDREEVIINSSTSGSLLGSITMKLSPSNTISVLVRNTNDFGIVLEQGYFSGFRVY
jgi:hypothetical protein